MSISDGVLSQHKAAKEIFFSGRRFNYAAYRYIWLPNGPSIELADLFPALEVEEAALPEMLNKLDFRKFAARLNKVVHVYREDGGTGGHYPLFVVYPEQAGAGAISCAVWELILEVKDYTRYARQFTPCPKPRWGVVVARISLWATYTKNALAMFVAAL